MLKYLGTFQTGAIQSCHTITEVHYFYETSTNIVYMQCAYEHNLTMREASKPLVKPDGSYLTYQEWLDSQDEHREKERFITQKFLDLELER